MTKIPSMYHSDYNIVNEMNVVKKLSFGYLMLIIWIVLIWLEII